MIAGSSLGVNSWMVHCNDEKNTVTNTPDTIGDSHQNVKSLTICYSMCLKLNCNCILTYHCLPPAPVPPKEGGAVER